MRNLLPATLTFILTLPIYGWGCDPPDVAGPSDNPGSIRVEGPRIETIVGDHSLSATADDLTVNDSTGEMTMNGAVHISLNLEAPVEVTAQKLVVDPNSGIIEMMGGVRASFQVPEGAEIGGEK